MNSLSVSSDTTSPALDGPASHPADGVLDPARRWAACLLAAAAMGLCLYLLWTSFSGAAIAGCQEGGGCTTVLASRWRAWLGIPTSAMGAVVYAAILIALAGLRPVVRQDLRRLAWSVLLVAVAMALGAGLWFVVLQLLVVRAFCPYCTTVHACGLLLAVVLLTAPGLRRSGLLTPARRRRLAARAGVGVALLIGGQVLAPASTSSLLRSGGQFGHYDVYDTGPGPDRAVRLSGSPTTLNPHHMPMLGSPDAPYIAVLFFDYYCPSCRTQFQLIKKAMAHYAPQLGIVCLPLGCTPNPDEQEVPSCRYALLAASVWRRNPEKFATFHDWLMTDPPLMLRASPKDGIPSLEHSTALAASLVGGHDTLEQDIADPELTNLILQWRGWRRSLAAGKILPALNLHDMVLLGESADTDELFTHLEAGLGIKPLDQTRPTQTQP
ncbi:MAG: thioredoxin domain-containing protein [Phycisphaeraceae bacterium]|nr:thioredoxin domain-containing protein [Phycisphaeraceae bacterium]